LRRFYVRKEALSADDLANLLGVTIRTLRNWERDGSGPPREIRDLEPFYALETLVPWLKKHRPDVELGDRARISTARHAYACWKRGKRCCVSDTD